MAEGESGHFDIERLAPKGNTLGSSDDSILKKIPSDKLKAKNLTFFQGRYPALFKKITGFNAFRFRLAINKQLGKIDIFEGGHSRYQGDMVKYCDAEVDQFVTRFSSGKYFTSTQPSEAELYNSDRFFSLSIKKIFSSLNQENRTANHSYPVPSFYPVLVVFSVGLHIELLLNRKEVFHLVIVEIDFENLFHSLSLMDWTNLCEKFSGDDKSITIVYLGNNRDKGEGNAGELLKVLNRHTPMFPLQTFFYNHLGLKKYHNVIDIIKREITVNYHQWGMYDDEINQFNNALHNISSNFKLLSSRAKGTVKVPVCIIGSGPSLDKRIADLKKLKDDCMLVSCGTALQALNFHGIQPHFHVEIESHYATYESCIKKLESEDPEYLRGITLIASAQVTPKACQVFKQTLLYFKDSSALSYVFSQEEDKIYHATPTCTNAAFSIFKYLEANCILLFGCDMGFHGSIHHSRGSIYYDENASDYIKHHTQEQEKKNNKDLIEIGSVHDNKMYTTGIYYTALRCLERSVSSFKGRVFNCSEGAVISGTRYLSAKHISSEIAEYFQGQSWCELECGLLNLCEPWLKPLEIANFEAQSKLLNDALESVCLQMLEIVSKHRCYELKDAVSVASKIIVYLRQVFKSTHGQVYYLLRGTMWHFLHVLLSHGMSLEDRSHFYVQWQSGVARFLLECPMHCRKVLAKNYPDMTDPWLNGSLHDVGEP